MGLWGLNWSGSGTQRKDIRDSPHGKVTVCFKKSNGYPLKVFSCCMLALSSPTVLGLVWSRFFIEVRRAEDNMTPRSRLKSPVIFDRSLNRYFGAKRDNGACSSTIRLSSFFIVCMCIKTKKKCVTRVKSLQLREIFSTKIYPQEEPLRNKSLFATLSCLISLCSERK